MNQRAVVVALLGLSLAAACGKKEEPVMQPTPAAGGGVNQDSIDRARADSIRNAQRIADSIRAANDAARNAASREETMRALTAAIHFEYDAFTIGGDDQALLDQKAAIMQANPGLRIRITGHCDERGSDEYNLALGMNRATAAKDYLVRRGIDPSRIEVASLGREVPVDPASNESAWAKNRRDEFDVIAGGSNLVPAR
jgi:peptidoglycan-associated lipoprotein